MPQEQFDLEGNIDALALCDVVQFLDQSRQRGVLRIDDPAGHRCECHITEGGLVDAHLGHLHEREALVTVLGWKVGRFAFQRRRELSPRPNPISVPALVMEVARLEDELERHAGCAPDLHAKLTPKAVNQSPPDTLDCGADQVYAAIEANPGVTTADLEAGLRLAPLKIRLSVAWLGSTGYLHSRLSATPRLARDLSQRATSWYDTLLQYYPAGIRVLVASSPDLAPNVVQGAVAHLAKEVGAPPVVMSIPSDGPAMARIRPPQGGLLSLTFLPLRSKHLFLFQSFARSAELLLITQEAPPSEIEQWETEAPLHVPRLTLEKQGSPDSLASAIASFVTSRTKRMRRI